MNKNINVEKDALQRQLEHHLDELCHDINKDMSIISEHLDVTQDNFTCMTYVGESLESLHSAVIVIMEYIQAVKTTEKMINELLPKNILNE